MTTKPPSPPRQSASTCCTDWSGAELRRQLHLAGAAPEPHLERDELLAAWFRHQLGGPERFDVDGVVELLPEGFGFLRFPGHDLVAGAADVYLSPSQVRGLNLQTGHRVRGAIRPPRGNERFFALLHVDTVDGTAPEAARLRPAFGALQPIVATVPLPLGGRNPLWRTAAALAPWCRGQRALLRLPASWPRAVAFAGLAEAILAANPDVRVRLGLFDQRPEDLAAAKAACAALPGVACVGTTFDATAERHVATAELLLAMVQREVESGAAVVLLVDSLTALARQGQLAQSASGRYLAPGLDAIAVQFGKRLFASARATTEGGSLTVLASVLHDTGHQVDAAIAAEFTGRGNSELRIDTGLAEEGVAVPLDLAAVRTRPEDDVRPANERAAAQALREALLAMPPAQRGR